MKENITSSISELIKRAPKGWAKNASAVLGKKTSTIYAYASSKNSIENIDGRIKLHTVLKKMVAKYETQIENHLSN